MKTKIVSLAVFCCLFAFVSDAAAQSSAVRGVVIYAEGEEFSITRNQTTTDYSVRDAEWYGVDVREGDVVQTESDTFLEIQLSPARNVLRVAESTSFTVASLSASGGTSLSMIYGRVRAQVDQVMGSFRIRSQTAVCGVRGTDFGYEVVWDQSRSAVPTEARIFCFEGEVDVVLPSVGAGGLGSEADPISVNADEMLVIETPATQETVAVAPEVEPIAADLVAFWTENGFEGEMLETEEVGLAVGPSVEQTTVAPTSVEPGAETIPTPVAETADLEIDANLVVDDLASFGRRRALLRQAGWLLVGVGLVQEAVAAYMLFWGESRGSLTTEQAQTNAIAMGAFGLFTLVGSGICFGNSARLGREMRAAAATE